MRFPGPSADPPGHLALAVADPNGRPTVSSEGVHLTSPLAGIPLVGKFRDDAMGADRSPVAPIRAVLPPSTYGIQTEQSIGVFCGHNAPSEDRFMRLREPVDIESGRVTTAVLHRPSKSWLRCSEVAE